MIALKRSFSDTRRVRDLLSELPWVDLDRSDLAATVGKLPPLAAVIHTATEYGRGSEDIERLLEVNLLFPARLFTLTARVGTRVHLNTDTFYRPKQSDYALSKRQFLDWARRMSCRSATTLVNVRLHHVFGPRDDSRKFLPQVIRALVDNVVSMDLTHGKQTRDFVFVEDVVDAYLLILRHALSQPGRSFVQFEIGRGESMSIRRMVGTLKRLTGASTRLNFGVLPSRPGESLNTEARITRLKALGWKPRRTISEDLRETIEDGKAEWKTW